MGRQARRPRVSVLALVSILLSGWVPGTTLAQAWLPAKGNFDVGIYYTDVLNKNHYLPNGDELDVGHTRAHSVAVTLQYSPTDKILLTAGLPFVRSRYYGSRPHPTEIDNGDFHSSITDLQLSAHYQLLGGPVALAPFIVLIVPVKDYEALGHAAPGRHLREQWVGFSTGASLNDWIPRSYVQLRYSYGFVEKVANLGHDHSNVDLEFGYFATPSLSLLATASRQFAHGGIPVPVPPTHPLYAYHDQLAATTFLTLGAGASWSPRGNTSYNVFYARAVSGTNGHKLDGSLTVGFNMRFSTR